MKLLQYKGPFKNGDSITVQANYDYTYVHIGIQVPNSPDIAYVNDTSFNPVVRIGKSGSDYSSYAINKHGILEFDGFSQSAWFIYFLKNLPAEAIIDIAYKERSED